MPLEHYFTNNLNLKSEIKEIPYAINNIDFTFLSDNADYWSIDEEYIYFDNDDLLEEYNHLLDIIENIDIPTESVI